MSTRTYVLNFLGASMLPLPQGRFFMIKQATAALSLLARRRDGQPVEFTNVGAGLQYDALDAGKWYSLEVTSAAAQIVEIVISDDSKVSFANTVNVSGSVSVLDQLSTAIATGAPVNVLTATAQTIAANASRRRITIVSASTNTGSIYVQAVLAGAGRGYELTPGEKVEFVTAAALDVRNDSGATQTFTVFEES